MTKRPRQGTQRQRAAETALSATSGLGPHHSAPITLHKSGVVVNPPPSPRPIRAGHSRPVAPPSHPDGFMPITHVRIASLHPEARAKLRAGLEAQHEELNRRRAYWRSHLPGNPRSAAQPIDWNNPPPIPRASHLLGTLGHAAGALYKASPIPGAIAGFQGDAAEHRAVEQQSKAFSQVAEATTGYREIQHIRKHPLAGSLALAGLLPVGRAARFAELLRGARGAEDAARIGENVPLPRTPAQVEQHVGEAVGKAKGEGFGRTLPKVPKLERGQVTSETGGAAGAALRAGLRDPSGLKTAGTYERAGAALDSTPKSLREMETQQEAARSVARSRKAGSLAAAQRAALQSDRPYEAFMAAGAARKGMLPKAEFKGFQDLEPHLDELTRFVGEHEHLLPFQKQRLMESISRGIFDGKMPTKSERDLMSQVFGREGAESALYEIKHGAGDVVTNLLNIPRSIMASFDLSAPLRQGLVAMVAKPKVALPNMARMIRYAASPKGFDSMMESIHTRPTFALMQKHGVALTDLGGDLSSREEQFISNYAEHLHEAPGLRKTPLKYPLRAISEGVKASDRAYIGFLNKTRADLFDSLLHDAAAQGHDLHDRHLLDSIANFVNSSTGRGDLAGLAEHTKTMNALFFSPRLLYSRLNILGFGGEGKLRGLIPGSYYAGLHPFVRREAGKAARNLLGTISTVLYAAHLAGAEVGLDPRSADFAKVKVGNTRIDVAGGFSQDLVLLARLASGESVSSTTGRLQHLEGGFAGSSRLDVATRFLEGKAAPVPSGLIQALGGHTGAQHSGPLENLQGHLEPIIGQDIQNILQTPHGGGIPMAVGGGLVDLFGVGVNSYAPAGPKTHQDLSKLRRDSEAAGLPEPPPVVQADVKWKAALDDATYPDMTAFDRAKVAAQLFDERYGQHLEHTVLPQLSTEGQAEQFYRQVRSQLFPALAQWEAQLTNVQRQQAEAKQIPGQTPSSPPAHAAGTSRTVPAQAPPMQDVAYRTLGAARSPSKGTQGAAGPTGPYSVEQDSIAQGLASLARGSYSPAEALSQLLQSLASQPVSSSVAGPSGQTISFQAPKLSGKASKTARGAIALAQHFLGTPYVWGGESPKGFDCSGLLQYIYAAQGVRIPRTTFDQYKAGVRVPRSRLQPGDAVFFAGSDGTATNPGHVGIYIGHGLFIEAPHTGATVRVSRLAGYPGYVGARRYSR